MYKLLTTCTCWMTSSGQRKWQRQRAWPSSTLHVAPCWHRWRWHGPFSSSDTHRTIERTYNLRYVSSVYGQHSTTSTQTPTPTLTPTPTRPTHLYILTSDTRDFLKLFLRQAERHADILAMILARMSARMSVSASWNAGLSQASYVVRTIERLTTVYCLNCATKRQIYTWQRTGQFVQSVQCEHGDLAAGIHCKNYLYIHAIFCGKFSIF